MKLAVGFEAKPGEAVTTSFEAKLEKTVITGFEVKPEKIVAAGFKAKPPETIDTSFDAKLEKTIATNFEAKPVKTIRVVLRPKPIKNRPSGFEPKPLTNRRPWFQGSTKKSALLVSTCTVQTAHGAIRPLDRPATEYPTYATIPGHLHQVSYSSHDPRCCTPCRTYHLHTTRQANVILQTK
jgi:hypothetical protein